LPDKQQGILNKIGSWFTGESINEAYLLQLENTDDQLVLHIKDTKTGERTEVRGKPNYEIDYDADDELHRLLDVIGKASNISELMNGAVVNVNPKHPDGPKSYRAIEKAMDEGWSAKYKRSINCDNPKGFSQKAHCAGKKNEDVDLDEGVNDPHIFKAVFLAGGPGSGKSFVARNILGGTGLKTMNSDDVYEILMKKQDLALDPDTIASPQGQEIRDKAKMMTKRRSVNWIDGRLGLLIDGTGKDVAKYQKQAEFLRMLGYDVAMIFVNTSEEVAQQRNRQRARSLKPEMVTAMWNDVQQNLMKFQQIFGAGRFHIIDNSGGLEDLDRQKNFDKVYNETQRFLNTPPSKPAAKKWIQNQKAQNDATQRSERTTTNNTDSDGGVRTTN
jgi:dephospho-CoA kinase